jgi:hypothetical protein
MLNPGQQKQVTMTIDPNANSHPISTWDTASQKWVLAHGKVSVYLARSAGDIASTAFTTVVFPSSGIVGDVNGDGVVNCQDNMARSRLPGHVLANQDFSDCSVDGNGVIDVNDMIASLAG